jgi:hypothetical protein
LPIAQDKQSAKQQWKMEATGNRNGIAHRGNVPEQHKRRSKIDSQLKMKMLALLVDDPAARFASLKRDRRH